MSNFVVEILSHPYGGGDLLMETISQTVTRVNDRKCVMVPMGDRERFYGDGDCDLFASLVSRKEPGHIVGHFIEERHKRISEALASAGREDVLFVEGSPHTMYHVWNVSGGGYFKDMPGHWIADRKYEDTKWVPVSAVFSVESSLDQVRMSLGHIEK